MMEEKEKKEKTQKENKQSTQNGDDKFCAVLKLCGIDEEGVRVKCGELIKEGSNPSVEIEYHRELGPEVVLRVNAESEGDTPAKKVAKGVVKELKSLFGEKIYALEEETTLEEVVVALLKENGMTISTAESCTGGLFSARLVNVPGASEVFKEGFITYSNKSKRKYLGVKKGTLLKHTAVSDDVAREMAKGVINTTRADCSVAITGLAGPDGGTDKKKVGTVFIACSVNGNVVSKQFDFSGGRADVRQSAVTAALTMLRHNLLKYYAEKTF